LTRPSQTLVDLSRRRGKENVVLTLGARLTSMPRCARISAMSKTKDNNPSRGDLVRLTARCKAAG
ncbi:hypothetical protein, partial [Candidatus Binatus sp.]|uniref:hypothetical protein n=1 Tax=Candidatus Binatus sp. TaxID=2811406 RepID=UPI003CADBA52